MAAEQRTVVNFKETCIDPLAKLVMLEAMSFAVEKAESRMASLGKIFPGLETVGEPIIQDIKDIRFAVENLGVCAVKGPAAPGGGSVVPPSEPPPAAAIKQFSKREQELIKAMPEGLQEALARELSRAEGGPSEKPDFYVKGRPIVATKEQKKNIEAREPEKKERTLPGSWGPLTFKPKEGAAMQYSSPGEFLRLLHGGDISKIRGKGNYLLQLDSEGYEIYVGGKKIDPGIKKEAVEKLKGVGLTIQLKKGKIQPTPPGGVLAGASEAVGSRTATQFPKPWARVTDNTGKFLRFEDFEGHTVPEEVWRPFSSSELDKLAPKEKKA